MLKIRNINLSELKIETSFIVGLVIGSIISILVLYKLFEKRRYRRLWVSYALEAGDTLSFISEETGVPWKKIARVNKITAPYDLFYGDVIKVPKEFSRNRV